MIDPKDRSGSILDLDRSMDLYRSTDLSDPKVAVTVNLRENQSKTQKTIIERYTNSYAVP